MENCSFNTNISPYLNLDTQDKVVEKCSLHTALQVARTCTSNLDRYKDKIIVLNCLKEVFLSLDQLEKDDKQIIIIYLLRALTKADLKGQAYKVALFFHPLQKWFLNSEDRRCCHQPSSCWLPIFIQLNQTKTLEFIEDTLNNTERVDDAIELLTLLLPFNPSKAYTYKDQIRKLIQEEDGVSQVDSSADLARALMPYFPEEASGILKLLKSDGLTGLNWLHLANTMIECGETEQAQKIVDQCIKELPSQDPEFQVFHSLDILKALLKFNPKMFGEFLEVTLSSFDSQKPTLMIVGGYSRIGHLFKESDPEQAFKLYEKSREKAIEIKYERCVDGLLASKAREIAKTNLPEAIAMIDSIPAKETRFQAYLNIALDSLEDDH